MIFAKSRIIIALLVLFAMVIQFRSNAQAGRHRFDAPILDLLESCTDHMTLGFAYEEFVKSDLDDDGNIGDEEYLDEIYIVVSIKRLDTGEEVFRTPVPEMVSRLKQNGAFITDGIEIAVQGFSAKTTSIVYAKSDWLDYPDTAESAKILKSENQTGYIVAKYDSALPSLTPLSVNFTVTGDPDGKLLVNEPPFIGGNAEVEYKTGQPEDFTLQAKNCEATSTANNLIHNPSFEDGRAPWRFYTNGAGSFTTAGPATDGATAANVAIHSPARNVQLYQKNLSLEPNTQYQLTFDAMSNNGQDLQVLVHKHRAPYTNYGLRSARVDLTPSYQTFTWSFTTGNFNDKVSDARLRFWLAPFANAGDIYMIDNVVLKKSDSTLGAASVIHSSGVVTVEEDTTSLLAGGAVGDEESPLLTNQIYLPIILH